MLYAAEATQLVVQPPGLYASFEDGLSGPVFTHFPEVCNGYVRLIWTVRVPGGWRSLAMCETLH